MQATSSSEESLLETCTIDSSDLDSDSNEINTQKSDDHVHVQANDDDTDIEEYDDGARECNKQTDSTEIDGECTRKASEKWTDDQIADRDFLAEYGDTAIKNADNSKKIDDDYVVECLGNASEPCIDINMTEYDAAAIECLGNASEPCVDVNVSENIAENCHINETSHKSEYNKQNDESTQQTICSSKELSKTGKYAGGNTAYTETGTSKSDGSSVIRDHSPKNMENFGNIIKDDDSAETKIEKTVNNAHEMHVLSVGIETDGKNDCASIDDALADSDASKNGSTTVDKDEVFTDDILANGDASKNENITIDKDEAYCNDEYCKDADDFSSVLKSLVTTKTIMCFDILRNTNVIDFDSHLDSTKDFIGHAVENEVYKTNLDFVETKLKDICGEAEMTNENKEECISINSDIENGKERHNDQPDESSKEEVFDQLSSKRISKETDSSSEHVENIQDIKLLDIPDELFDDHENEMFESLFLENRNAQKRHDDNICMNIEHEPKEDVQNDNHTGIDVFDDLSVVPENEEQNTDTQFEKKDLPIDISTVDDLPVISKNEEQDTDVQFKKKDIPTINNSPVVSKNEEQDTDVPFEEKDLPIDQEIAKNSVSHTCDNISAKKKNEKIIEEIPESLWDDEDDELAKTLEELHIKKKSAFINEEIATICDIGRYKDKKSEKDKVKKPIIPPSKIEKTRNVQSRDFKTISEEDTLNDLIKRQTNIEYKMRCENVMDMLQPVDLHGGLQVDNECMQKGLIPSPLCKAKSSFIPKVDMKFTAQRKGAKLVFLTNCLLVLSPLKQCRVSTTDKKMVMKYASKWYKIKTPQCTSPLKKADILSKSDTSQSTNVYSLLLNADSFRSGDARLTENAEMNEILKISIKDKVLATQRCIEKNNYGMAFLVSKGNKDAEQIVTNSFIDKFISPTFHPFFQCVSESVLFYHKEPKRDTTNDWTGFLSVMCNKQQVTDFDISHLLSIEKSNADQFYVLVYLHQKHGKCFFQDYKHVMLMSYEYMRIADYINVKGLEDVRSFYRDFFLITNTELANVPAGRWGWRNYVEKGLNKIIGIDDALASTQTKTELANDVRTDGQAQTNDNVQVSVQSQKNETSTEAPSSSAKSSTSALFDQHIKKAREHMKHAEHKPVPDYASTFADFFVSAPTDVSNVSYDDNYITKTFADDDKTNEPLIAPKAEDKKWGFGWLSMFKRKEKTIKVKCSTDCDFKYDPQTKRWINTKTANVSKQNTERKTKEEKKDKSTPIPVSTVKKSTKKTKTGTIASRYVIESAAEEKDDVDASNIFKLHKKG